MLGYLSEKDGAILAAQQGLPVVSHTEEKLPRKPYHKFFFDQACSVKMIDIGLDLSFSIITQIFYFKLHTHTKEPGQYSDILYETSLVSNRYLLHSDVGAGPLREKTLGVFHFVNLKSFSSIFRSRRL